MLSVHVSIFVAKLLCLLIWISPVHSLRSKHLVKVDDENWRDILKGEWMINFYSKAAWCPACKEMERPWNAFADWSGLKNGKLKVAQVDVSENPGLSGRFLVTALPSIYHVKDGVFRLYNGPKDKEDFTKFVKQKQWSSVEKVPSWCYPDSFQMSLVSALFRFSMKAKDFHSHLVDKKGVPSILSFGIFATVTLTVGCILGFFMVLVIDHFVPKAKNRNKQSGQAKDKQKMEKKNEKSQQQMRSDNNSKDAKDKQIGNKNGSLINANSDKSDVRQRKADSNSDTASITAQVKNLKSAAIDKKRD